VGAFVNFSIRAKFLLGPKTLSHIPKLPKHIPLNTIPKHSLFASKTTMSPSISLDEKHEAILKNN